MKRQVLTLIAVLTLVLAGALIAQSGAPAQNPTSLPPSQQVDQSGQPETGTGPDVDVDVGRNAEDGVMDVDVKKNTDPDTAAQGNDHPSTHGTMGTTGTQGTMGTTGTQGTMGTTGTSGTTGNTNLNNDNDTTGTTYGNDTNTGMGGDTDNLPNTGSEMPLVGLIGLLALGAALAVRSIR
jgi:LPXTG-motif cell wall-anchored protein